MNGAGSTGGPGGEGISSSAMWYTWSTSRDTPAPAGVPGIRVLRFPHSRKWLSVALLATLFLGLLPAPGPARAQAGLDFDVPGGHFYTQTDGQNGASGTGYAV